MCALQCVSRACRTRISVAVRERFRWDIRYRDGVDAPVERWLAGVCDARVNVRTLHLVSEGGPVMKTLCYGRIPLRCMHLTYATRHSHAFMTYSSPLSSHASIEKMRAIPPSVSSKHCVHQYLSSVYVFCAIKQSTRNFLVSVRNLKRLTSCDIDILEVINW